MSAAEEEEAAAAAAVAAAADAPEEEKQVMGEGEEEVEDKVEEKDKDEKEKEKEEEKKEDAEQQRKRQLREERLQALRARREREEEETAARAVEECAAAVKGLLDFPDKGIIRMVAGAWARLRQPAQFEQAAEQLWKELRGAQQKGRRVPMLYAVDAIIKQVGGEEAILALVRTGLEAVFNWVWDEAAEAGADPLDRKRLHWLLYTWIDWKLLPIYSLKAMHAHVLSWEREQFGASASAALQAQLDAAAAKHTAETAAAVATGTRSAASWFMETQRLLTSARPTVAPRGTAAKHQQHQQQRHPQQQSTSAAALQSSVVNSFLAETPVEVDLSTAERLVDVLMRHAIRLQVSEPESEERDNVTRVLVQTVAQLAFMVDVARKSQVRAGIAGPSGNDPTDTTSLAPLQAHLSQSTAFGAHLLRLPRVAAAASSRMRAMPAHKEFVDTPRVQDPVHADVAVGRFQVPSEYVDAIACALTTGVESAKAAAAADEDAARAVAAGGGRDRDGQSASGGRSDRGDGAGSSGGPDDHDSTRGHGSSGAKRSAMSEGSATSDVNGRSTKKRRLPPFTVSEDRHAAAAAVTAMYALPHRSSADGVRFRTVDALNRHIDHTLRRQQLMNDTKGMHNRGWFPTTPQWVAGDTTARATGVTSAGSAAAMAEAAASNASGSSSGSSSNNTSDGAPPRPALQRGVSAKGKVLVDDSFTACPVTKEEFERIWDDDEEGWVYKNAVKLGIPRGSEFESLAKPVPGVANAQVEGRELVGYVIVSGLVVESWRKHGKIPSEAVELR